jgi:hypothetical protein
VHVSWPSKLTMGWPPDSISILFCGRNRATTLMLFAFDMMATRFPRSWEAQIHEGRAAQIGERARREAGMPARGGRARKGPLGTGSASFRGVVVCGLSVRANEGTWLDWSAIRPNGTVRR